MGVSYQADEGMRLKRSELKVERSGSSQDQKASFKLDIGAPLRASEKEVITITLSSD